MLIMYNISVSDTLIRRISRNPDHWKILNGVKSATSVNFKTKRGEDGLSVDILALTTLEKSVRTPTTHFVALLSAEIPICLGFECRHDPIENNEAHALIIGNITDSSAKKLAAASIAHEFPNIL